MRLNLGAGRIIFPLTKEWLQDPANSQWATHLYPAADEVMGGEWVNVDKYPNPGINETVDLFKFPWVQSSNGMPFPDNSVEYIYCSHILEHVPHRVSVSKLTPLNWMNRYRTMVDELDGFFVFMYECWRVLKPGGTVQISSPFFNSHAAYVDPTHTRYLSPSSFDYMSRTSRDGHAPFDYHLPMVFDLVGDAIYRFTPEWWERILAFRQNNPDVSSVREVEIGFRYFNVIDEFRVTLKAVKDSALSQAHD